MDIFVCDLGGTRVKYGWRIKKEWEVGVADTPPDLPGFFNLLQNINQGRSQTEAWGIGLPGGVDHRTGDWLRPAAFSLQEQISRAEMNQMFSQIAIGVPSLVTNDLTANSYGVSAGKSGVVVQMSTGVGARVIATDGVLSDPHHPGSMMLFDLREEMYEQKVKARSFYDWLAWSKIQNWISSDLRGIPWHELVKTQDPEIRQIAKAFVAYSQRAFQESPERDFLWAAGGGALALREMIEEEALQGDLSIVFADDAETPGLYGLAYMLDRSIAC